MLIILMMLINRYDVNKPNDVNDVNNVDITNVNNMNDVSQLSINVNYINDNVNVDDHAAASPKESDSPLADFECLCSSCLRMQTCPHGGPGAPNPTPPQASRSG